MGTGLEVAAWAAVATAIVGTGAQMNEAHQQRKAQKTVQRRQRNLQAKEEAEALETRKQQINQMREQMNIGGYQTATVKPQATTGSSPVKGTLGDTLG